MAKIYHIDLTLEERNLLEDIVKRRLSTSEAVKRSFILLASDRLGDKKWHDSKIASEYKVAIRTVERLRERFVNDGLAICLKGKPRLNTDKIKFDGTVEAHLIALRCSDPPDGRSRWSLHLLADKMVELRYVDSISYESVRQIQKKIALNLGELQNG
jgi:hypothetical protein